MNENEGYPIKVNDKEKGYVLDLVDRWEYTKGEYWQITQTFISNMKKENKRNKR